MWVNILYINISLNGDSFQYIMIYHVFIMLFKKVKSQLIFIMQFIKNAMLFLLNKDKIRKIIVKNNIKYNTVSEIFYMSRETFSAEKGLVFHESMLTITPYRYKFTKESHTTELLLLLLLLLLLSLSCHTTKLNIHLTSSREAVNVFNRKTSTVFILQFRWLI